MLFVESRTAERDVAGPLRIAVLEALQDRGLVPLIRASRLYCFEQALTGGERAGELERLVADWSDSEGDAPYVRGDVFCFDDYAHFLIFGEAGDGVAGIRAGIVYDAATDEPARKLEEFCRHVGDAVESAAARAGVAGFNGAGFNGADHDGAGLQGVAPARFEWRARDEGQAGVSAHSSIASSTGTLTPSDAPRGAEAAERSRVAELLEDVVVRDFLRRLSDARADGLVSELTAHAGGVGAHEPAREALVARLAGAGLVRREVQVSCRKDGRSLFRLPSPEALSMVTASNAVCSECGAAVADERAEELVTPTPLAASMLKDGAWLLNSLRSVLVELGLPEGSIDTRAPSDDGEAQMVANVCGEPFLFVLRDGDFNAAHARRALESEAETHAAHLVVLATGKVHDEARVRLREHARRRSRTGGGMEVFFVEGTEKAAAELRQALGRVSQAALTRELYELDASAGFNVGYMLAERFRLVHGRGALQDLAASAAGSLAGSLREI